MDRTLSECIGDTVELSDQLISLVQRARYLEDLVAENTQFAGLYAAIKTKILKIQASMESLPNTGVNQAFITSVNEELPGLLPASLKLNSFTKTNSQVNLGVALEYLGEGKVAMVSQAISSLLALIVKLYRWVITTLTSYLKSRRQTNLMGISTTRELQKAGVNALLFERLKGTQELKAARLGFDWLYSVYRPDVGKCPFNEGALIEQWPQLITELEYEYKQLTKAYDGLVNDLPFTPNVCKVQKSGPFERFFKALPQGVGHTGEPFALDEALKQFNDNPQRAMVSLTQRLRHLMQLPNKDDDTTFLQTALDIGGQMELYNNVDRLVFDSLNSRETLDTLNRLNTQFATFYNTVKATRFERPQEEVDAFVKYVNFYSEKINTFVYVLTVVAFLDSSSYDVLKDVSRLVLKYVSIAQGE